MTNFTAERLVQLFFKERYCENGLPLEIDWGRLTDDV
jgi:hypothetical protein